MKYDHDDSFLLDFEPNKFYFVQNQKENCHHDDHFLFNLKGTGFFVLSVDIILPKIEGLIPAFTTSSIE